MRKNFSDDDDMNPEDVQSQFELDVADADPKQRREAANRWARRVIAWRRRALVISQLDCAVSAGISLATWSNIETGKVGLTARSRDAVTTALDWAPSTLDEMLRGRFNLGPGFSSVEPDRTPPTTIAAIAASGGGEFTLAGASLRHHPSGLKDFP